MEVVPTSIMEVNRNQLPSSNCHIARRTQRGQVFSCTVPVVKNLRRGRSKWLPASLALLSPVESLELSILESDLLVRSLAPTDVVVGQVKEVRQVALNKLEGLVLQAAAIKPQQMLLGRLVPTATLCQVAGGCHFVLFGHHSSILERSGIVEDLEVGGNHKLGPLCR